MAGRIQSKRSSSARRSFMAPTSSISPTSTRRSIAPGGAAALTRKKALVKQLAGCLADPAARRNCRQRRRARGRTAGGALDRTMAALEPYLLQLATRDGGRQCVSRLLAPRSRCTLLLLDDRRALWCGGGAGDMQRAGFDAGIPCFASATIMSGGAGKTPMCWPYQDAARPRRDAGRAQVAAMVDGCTGRLGSIPTDTRPQISVTSR